jgi:signal transduction histidine kinase
MIVTPGRASLERYGVLDGPQDPDLKAITRLAAHVCGALNATVNLLDETTQYQAAAEGFEPGTCPREESMCAVTVELDHPVQLRDARTDPRFADNPFVTGRRANVRFYAASPLRVSDGRTVGTLCVFDDQPRTRDLEPGQQEALDDLAAQVVQVLELRAETNRLAATNDELLRSNADLVAFAGRIAHDLRNPIAATTGFLSLARGAFGDELTGRARECVEHADGAVRRMADLVDDLLAFARVGATIRRTDVDLGAVMTGVVRDLQALIGSTGGTVEYAELPVVQSDPTLLRQVLQNLVTNALTYSRPGVPPRALISAKEAGGRWSVQVSDNGRGIPVEARATVFELFVRLPHGAEVQGSGIGLATCARIAKALDAQITITDTEGGGTTFTVAT